VSLGGLAAQLRVELTVDAQVQGRPLTAIDRS
jgi:hypothetical protein